MKIAVLISGEYREFPIAHKFWSFLSWADVDCYFATWKYSFATQADTSVESPKELITSEQIHNYIKVVDLDISDRVVIDQRYYSGWAMINRWHKAISLMQESGIQYDRVILIRPDLALEYEEDVFKQFVYEIIDNDNNLYGMTGTNLGQPVPLATLGRMNDVILIGTQNSIMKLMQLPLEEFFNAGEPDVPVVVDIHKYLAKHCSVIYESLFNMPIPGQCIVRTNCRTLINPTYNDCKLKAKVWWEEKIGVFYWMGENIWDYGLYNKKHPELKRQRIYSPNSINLWDNFDLGPWVDSRRGGIPWYPPDTKEIYLRNSIDKNKKYETTYDETDIVYEFNSLGFRVGLGPQEFEDVQDNPVFLVGGCSVTEGVGLPERHIWHSFLTGRLVKSIKKPIAKFNLGKGGISIDSIIRYVYVAIEHYNLHPDMVYLLLPPIHRKELIISNNNAFVFHYIPGQPIPDNVDYSLIETIKSLNKNSNYRQMYHDCFRNLLLIKWFLASKNIPFFFSFWHDDFNKDIIKYDTQITNDNDCNIPNELSYNYITTKIKDDCDIIIDEWSFPQTIARDYAHFGPNSHRDLGNQIYDKLLEKEDFIKVLNKWENNA